VTLSAAPKEIEVGKDAGADHKRAKEIQQAIAGRATALTAQSLNGGASGERGFGLAMKRVLRSGRANHRRPQP
jgi:hypothetical protein